MVGLAARPCAQLHYGLTEKHLRRVRIYSFINMYYHNKMSLFSRLFFCLVSVQFSLLVHKCFVQIVFVWFVYYSVKQKLLMKTGVRGKAVKTDNS